MRLSTRSRYGMRALVDIARQSREEPVRLKDIARRQDVSLSYLEHIIGPLIAGGLLRSTRGPGGGLSLLREPQEIPLVEVISLLEGPLGAVDCVSSPDVCQRSLACATRRLWVELADAMDGVLRSKTLADLIHQDESEARGACVPEAMKPLRVAAPGPGGLSAAGKRSPQ